MAFKDISKDLYGGKVHFEYKDSNHTYAVWIDGVKQKRPVSVTTIKGDTLEKKGLQTWPMGLALRHLLGFYDFDGDSGERMTGFSDGVGVLWDIIAAQEMSKDNILSHCVDASKAWTKAQKAGADVGTLVHDAVEQYITGTPFEITVDEYRKRVIQKEGEQAITPEWEAKAPGEVEKANMAFGAFKGWWATLGAKVVLAEEILYSLEHHVAGTMDYLLEIPGKGLVLSDLKTTNASKKAGSPQGVYYDFFIQLGIYASMLHEMWESEPDTAMKIDDLLIISARKDGGFDHIYASDLGLSVEDCRAWGDCVIICYELMKQTKKALLASASITEEE